MDQSPMKITRVDIRPAGHNSDTSIIQKGRQIHIKKLYIEQFVKKC